MALNLQKRCALILQFSVVFLLAEAMLCSVHLCINLHLFTEWSLFKMFSRTLTEACPLATSSKVYVDITDNPEVKLKQQNTSVLLFDALMFL